MKILYHHRTRGQGAERVHILEIVNALRKLGNEVYILSPPGVDIEHSKHDADKPKKQWIKKVYDVFPQSILEILRLSYNFFAYFRLKRIVKKYGIDFIYERYAFLTWVGPYFARKHHIPIILEVNEASGLNEVTGQVLVGLATRIERKVFQMADAIVVVSDFLKRYIQRMGINENKIYVIPNAVNLGLFNPDDVKNDLRRELNINDKIVIGFVGAFVSWNNLKLLIDIFKDVSKERTDIHLLLVGDGPLRGELERKVHQENLKDKVSFTGRVEYEDVPKFIHVMDICVIPKSNEYRSPMKLFEYMAMAKPVVAPRLEPIEKVVNNSNGLLFDAENRASLKEVIKALVEDAPKRKEIGKMARRTVKENYTWENNAREIIKIYKFLEGERYIWHKSCCLNSATKP
ncbi:MAG: hypothetical protein DRO89_02280 [Candidatus Altiarchaeales archaeon]|nr:MAG: hypothetical protein DRO89_02280 [Candidatus Altiarchaeales archaeon]